MAFCPVAGLAVRPLRRPSAHVPAPVDADSRAIFAALDIHERMRTVLAPATVDPPVFGDLLSRLHPAAAAYVMAVATMKG